MIRSLGNELGRWNDPTLDHLAAREFFDPEVREWSIVLLADPFPEARVAARAHTAASLGDLHGRLTREDDLEVAWFLPEDRVPGRPEARSARLVSWDGANATVEHDGACDLVIAQSFDPGWTARINGTTIARVNRVDGGYLGVRLPGSGIERVELRYSPPGWRWWVWMSSLSSVAAIIALALSLAIWIWQGRVEHPAVRSRAELLELSSESLH